MTNTEIDWQAISAALRQPFNPADVDFRPQGKPSNGGNVQVVAYVDARTVMARLDEACGPGGWSFTYEPIVVANGQVQIAKGRLEIHGVVREDVGEASNFDPSKGCVSDTLKRVAVQFGVGRYLYDIERTWVKAQGDRLSDETIAHLRAKLPRPDGVAPARPASPPARRDIPQTATGTSSRPQATPAASQAQTTQDAPAIDTLALTHASALDQKRLSGQLAARFPAAEAQANFLRSVTERAIDPANVRDGNSDLTVPELARVSERLTRIPAANGGGRH